MIIEYVRLSDVKMNRLKTVTKAHNNLKKRFINEFGHDDFKVIPCDDPKRRLLGWMALRIYRICA